MAPSLQIRELPADIYEVLSRRAKKQGRSLAQQAIAELRRMPELEARQQRLEVLERVRARLQQPGGDSSLEAPEDLIRQDRDR